MTRVTIRPATREDMPQVARVFRASYSQALPYLPTLHTPQEDLSHFSNELFLENIVFVAETSPARIVGFIAFDREFVNQLYLLPEVQRHGIGSRLLELAKEQVTSLKLWTFQKNANALHFYEKHGFQTIRRTDGAANEEKEPDVLLEWQGDPSGSRPSGAPDHPAPRVP